VYKSGTSNSIEVWVYLCVTLLLTLRVNFVNMIDAIHFGSEAPLEGTAIFEVDVLELAR